MGVGSSGYQYTNTLDISLNVSLFQGGYPFDSNSEVRSAPLIVDLDADGSNEVIFSDYNS